MRGIVELYDAHRLAVVQRLTPERVRLDVELSAAPAFEPPPGGIMVVFRVLGRRMEHSPEGDVAYRVDFVDDTNKVVFTYTTTLVDCP